MKVLCICTANYCRSVTLAAMLNATDGIEARSAGTHPGLSGKEITRELLLWADVIIVFEDMHVEVLKKRFFGLYRKLTVINLSVPDEYMPFDPDLVRVLQAYVKGRLRIDVQTLQPEQPNP